MKAESRLTYHLAFIRGLIVVEVVDKEAANGLRVSSSSLSSATLSVRTNRQRAPLWSRPWFLLLLSSAQVNLCCQLTKTGDQKVTVMSLMTIGILWEMLHVSQA